jgi:hypothetical protein
MQSRNRSPIMLAGHSHVICFGIMHEEGAVREIELRADPRVRGVQAPFLTMDPDAFARAVCSLANGHQLVVLWSGWSDLLFMDAPLFDFVSSRFPALPLEPSATPVPEAMVRAHESFRHYPAMMAHYLTQFRGADIRELVVLCQPPPKRSNHAIRDRLGKEGVLLDRAKALGFDLQTAPITPPFIRLKFWGLIDQMNHAAADKAGAIYIPAPRQAQDEHGFLLEEYWSDDVMHANEKYGRLYLDQVVATLESKP